MVADLHMNSTEQEEVLNNASLTMTNSLQCPETLFFQIFMTFYHHLQIGSLSVHECDFKLNLPQKTGIN